MLELLKKMVPGIFLLPFLFFLSSCGNKVDNEEKPKNISQFRAMEHDELVKRGAYLVTAGGCNDCHSPKRFDEKGMHIDSTRLLSGSPSQMQLPPFESNSLTPGNWIQMAPDVTAFVGPWGVSYAANLTPDSATGIGAWTKEAFVRTIKTGRHLGLEDGRPILPPMPWENFALLEEADLEAIFTYLKSLPPVNNRVMQPVNPNDALKMARNTY
jgi:hypothetical protein